MKKKRDIKLGRKINIGFQVISFVAIVMTTIFLTIAYYSIFKKEIFKNMKNYALTLQSTGVLETEDTFSNINLDSEEFRVTLVDENGAVLYDSIAMTSQMPNHGNRPEIKEAKVKGQGSSIRRSETLDKSTFYYALRLENGSILRLSQETRSIWNVFYVGVPTVVVIVLSLIIVIFIITGYLTKSIIKPIEQMANDLDHIDDISSYEEIRPFIDTIQKQHTDILKSARMRQEFTANVSHELKTPLTAISGYSELIENGMAADEDVQRFAGEIHRNSNRLLTLINDIIRLSELDTGEQTLSMEEVDLYKVAGTAVDMLSLSADKHHVLLEVTGSHGVICANKMMMEELVYNLVDNAIRYNVENGKVIVKIDHSNGAVELTVSDTGIGIPKEHQELIFQRFYRVDKSRSKSTGGTGLGLAIVKHIVAQHGASLGINSQTGKGTEIKVVFPDKKEEQSEQDRGKEPGNRI